MNRAKEGSRTPTRVTPLEPERIALDGFDGKSSGVGLSGSHQETSENSSGPQNTGACTTIPSSAFVSASRRSGGARPPGLPRIDGRVRYAGQTYTVRAVNDTMRVARIWRLPSKGGGLELLASYDVLEPVRRRDYMDREEVRMECTLCGAAHTENARADAIMAHVIRRATCLFCGTKTMRRARGA